jgi:hypothetical protein
MLPEPLVGALKKPGYPFLSYCFALLLPFNFPRKIKRQGCGVEKAPPIFKKSIKPMKKEQSNNISDDKHIGI